MPAASERPAVPALPHTWRPFGVRLAGTVLGVGLLVVCALAWIGFDEATQARFTTFQRITLVVLGLLAAATWFALLRSRVVATPEHLTVVNGYRRRDFEWAQVVAIHMPPGAPWATLDLDDGDTCAVMGIQSSDGDRSRVALRQVRTLLQQRA